MAHQTDPRSSAHSRRSRGASGGSFVRDPDGDVINMVGHTDEWARPAPRVAGADGSTPNNARGMARER
jgi:hypothetical protein